MKIALTFYTVFVEYLTPSLLPDIFKTKEMYLFAKIKLSIILGMNYIRISVPLSFTHYRLFFLTLLLNDSFE